jgi:hypothetical protein
VEVDHQLEAHRPLDGQVGRPSALQELRNGGSRAPVLLVTICPVSHQPASFYKRPDRIHCRQPMPAGQIHDPCSVSYGERVLQRHQTGRAGGDGGLECGVESVRLAYWKAV